MARPTSLNDIVSQAICNALSRGNTRRCAAALAGISYASLCTWIRKGRETEEEPYHAFLGRLEKAEAEAEDTMVTMVRIGDMGWQGGAWWLERRRRRTWRRPIQPAAAPPDLSATDEEALWAAVQKLPKPKERKAG